MAVGVVGILVGVGVSVGIGVKKAVGTDVSVGLGVKPDEIVGVTVDVQEVSPITNTTKSNGFFNIPPVFLWTATSCVQVSSRVNYT